MRVRNRVLLAMSLAVGVAAGCSSADSSTDMASGGVPVAGTPYKGIFAGPGGQFVGKWIGSTTACGAAPIADAGTEASADAGADAAEAGTDAGVDAGSDVTVTSRGANGTLGNKTWAAWQDGAGAWTQLLPSSTGIYKFTPTTTRYGVVLICSTSATITTGRLYYRTTATKLIDARPGPEEDSCVPQPGPPAYHAFSGTLTNLPAAATRLTLGGAPPGLVLVKNGTNASWSFGPYFAGTYDESLMVTDFSPGPDTAPPVLRVLLLRNQSFAADVVRNIDFNVDGFAPGPIYTATANNAAAVYVLGVDYATSAQPTNGAGVMSVVQNARVRGATSMQDFFSVPAGAALAADEYVVTAAEGTGIASVARHFKVAANVTMTVPTPPAATFGVAATVPYLRPRYTFPAVASAQKYQASWRHVIDLKADKRDYAVDIDPAWLAGAAPYVFDFPDLSAAVGWQNAWAAPSSAPAGAVTTGLEPTTKTILADGYEIGRANATGAVP